MQFLYIASYCAFSYGLILNCIYAKILHSVKTALPPHYLEIIGGTDKKIPDDKFHMSLLT